jgi:prepilin-type processing-associated H-X9-DG protein
MNRGLTRVEVLVIAVVATLALAILLPGIAALRESSRRANCDNHQKQLALALLSYEAKHKSFPGYKQELAGQDASWAVMILPYFDRRDLWQAWKKGTPEKRYMRVFVCPSDPPGNAGPEDGPSAYAVNTLVCKDGKGLSVDYIQQHDGCAITLLLSENLRIDKAHEWWDTDPLKVGFTVGRMADNIRSNHCNGAVAAFCDGHVGFLRAEIDSTTITPASTLTLYNALVTPDAQMRGEEPLTNEVPD